MTAATIEISVQISSSMSEDRLAQLHTDIKRYLSHMLTAAQVGPAVIETSSTGAVRREEQLDFARLRNAAREAGQSSETLRLLRRAWAPEKSAVTQGMVGARKRLAAGDA